MTGREATRSGGHAGSRTGARTGPRDKRIVGAPVAPLHPEQGAVFVLLIGEAPGPRGADKSGIPFFGDAAGLHLYRALAGMQAAVLPPEVSQGAWDGARFAEECIRPLVHGVALGNAYDRCPTDNGHSFRAPTRLELEGAPNIARLAAEVETLRRRGLLGIVPLGRVAAKTIDIVLDTMDCTDLERVPVPHPSAQGLLSMAPDRGKGARMADLQAQWMQTLRDAVYAAGYPMHPMNAKDERP